MHVCRHRHDLSDYLAPRTQVSTYHFLRIFFVCFAQLLLLFLLSIVSIVSMASTGLQPSSFISRVHDRFTRIDTQETSSVPPSTISVTVFAWWLVPILSLLSVGVFVFGDVEDAVRGYLNDRRDKKYTPSANESWVDTSDLPCR
jgi:dolichol kinase